MFLDSDSLFRKGVLCSNLYKPIEGYVFAPNCLINGIVLFGHMSKGLTILSAHPTQIVAKLLPSPLPSAL